MLKDVRLKGFTVFNDTTISFAKGINIITGENGSGKTHVLKAIYSMISASAEVNKKKIDNFKKILQVDTASKLVNVFRPEALGRLVRRHQGRNGCSISLTFSDPKLNSELRFSSVSKEVKFEVFPQELYKQEPVFFPTRELLTLYPNFISMYDGHYFEFEETYRDTCSLLGRPLLRGARQRTELTKLADELEEVLGGQVILDNNGHFYLKSTGQGTFEMPLVAEGMRKLAMVVQLILNGQLRQRGFLFWDEPEANLNPKLIKILAKVILGLSNCGIQVFITSHSLFMLREFDSLLSSLYPKVQAKYFSFINAANSADGTQIFESDDYNGLDPLVLLDEEVAQAEKYFEDDADE